MNAPLKIQIILGSTRQNRMGETVGKWVHEQSQAYPGWVSEYLDLRDYPLPFYNEHSTPKQLAGKYENEVATQWAAKIQEADGYIMVTPEYNHGYSAVLKNALDYVYNEWNNKPVAFVSYGGISGGIRAVEQLRQVVIELQMAPIREGVHIQFARHAFDERGKPKDAVVSDKAKLMFVQLEWWANALKAARNEA